MKSLSTCSYRHLAKPWRLALLCLSVFALSLADIGADVPIRVILDKDNLTPGSSLDDLNALIPRFGRKDPLVEGNFLSTPGEEGSKKLFLGSIRGIPSGRVTAYSFPQPFSQGSWVTGPTAGSDILAVRTFDLFGGGQVETVFRPAASLDAIVSVSLTAGIELVETEAGDGMVAMSSEPGVVKVTMMDRVYGSNRQVEIRGLPAAAEAFEVVRAPTDGEATVAIRIENSAVSTDERIVLTEFEAGMAPRSRSYTLAPEHSTMFNGIVTNGIGDSAFAYAPIAVIDELDPPELDSLYAVWDDTGVLTTVCQIHDYSPMSASNWFFGGFPFSPNEPVLTDDGQLAFIAGNPTGPSDEPFIGRLNLQTGVLDAVSISSPGGEFMEIFDFTVEPGAGAGEDRVTFSSASSQAVADFEWARNSAVPVVGFSVTMPGSDGSGAVVFGVAGGPILLPGARGGGGDVHRFLLIDRTMTESEAQQVGLERSFGLSVAPVVLEVDVITDAVLDTDIELEIVEADPVVLPFTVTAGGDFSLEPIEITIQVDEAEPMIQLPDLSISLGPIPAEYSISWVASGFDDYTIQDSLDARTWNNGERIEGAIAGEEITRSRQIMERRRFLRLLVEPMRVEE